MTKLPKLLALAVLLALKAHSTGDAATPWKTLAPGLELRVIAATTPSPAGDSKITVLRIDPKLWQIEFMGISRTGETQGHTGADQDQVTEKGRCKHQRYTERSSKLR